MHNWITDHTAYMESKLLFLKGALINNTVYILNPYSLIMTWAMDILSKKQDYAKFFNDSPSEFYIIDNREEVGIPHLRNKQKKS